MNESYHIIVTYIKMHACMHTYISYMHTYHTCIHTYWYTLLFCRTNHPKSKIGTDDSRKALKDMAEAYNSLSDAELAKLVAEADKQNIAREKLLHKPISNRVNEEACDSHLRASQVQRLNQARLDISLHEVVGSSIWDSGLALGDHVCALKPCFVSSQLGNEAEVQAFMSKHLGYDPTIEKNPDNIPSFSRSCMWFNYGLCEQDGSYSAVKVLMGQLHAALSFRRLGTSPFILHFDTGASSSRSTAPESESWMVISTVTAKPISYTGVCMSVVQGLRFSIKTTPDNVPCILSVNVAIKELHDQFLKKGGSPEAFSLEAWVSQKDNNNNYN